MDSGAENFGTENFDAEDSDIDEGASLLHLLLFSLFHSPHDSFASKFDKNPLNVPSLGLLPLVQFARNGLLYSGS